MSHELTLDANGRAEMAFVGETPWHGLGQAVTLGASIGVWSREAGLNWQANEAAVLYHRVGDAPGKVRHVEANKVLYRSDSGAPLSVVGSKYKVVQPMEILEFFRDLTESGGWHIHTAGSLRGGRKVWAMASQNESAVVGEGDALASNLLLATSLDGSMQTIATMTTVRVVCANTLSMAVFGAGARGMVKTNHRTRFEADDVKGQLDVAPEAFQVFMNHARELADTPVRLDEAYDILQFIFGAPASAPAPKSNLSWMGDLSQVDTTPGVAEDEKTSRSTARVLELFSGAGRGSQLPSSRGTRWGLLNSVTEFVDHEMGRSADTRLDSAWFGRGADIKAKAAQALAVSV
jgi:phage/plasmid-like protein (TIGR03299 family)